MIPPRAIYRLTEATWPPVRSWRMGPVTLREGAGGGSRVSAATVDGPLPDAEDLARAEAEMRGIGQPPLFMVRQGEADLDAALAAVGYVVKDPVTGWAAPTASLTGDGPPPMRVIEGWPPLAMQREIWAKGGIGPGRIAVMDRVTGPKVALLGRVADRPGGVAFVAVAGGAAMLHALHVAPGLRRRGLARHMVLAAARWAARHGAETLALLVTRANAPANALYASMGFTPVGEYHYRIRPEPE